MTRRSIAAALVLVLAPAWLLTPGCNRSGDAPTPGEVYVLSKPAPMWTLGLESGTKLQADAGAIVRVVDLGTSPMGNPFVKIHVERGMDDPIFGDDTTGKTGYIAAGDFHAAPTALP